MGWPFWTNAVPRWWGKLTYLARKWDRILIGSVVLVFFSVDPWPAFFAVARGFLGRSRCKAETRRQPLTGGNRSNVACCRSKQDVPSDSYNDNIQYRCCLSAMGFLVSKIYREHVKSTIRKLFVLIEGTLWLDYGHFCACTFVCFV